MPGRGKNQWRKSSSSKHGAKSNLFRYWRWNDALKELFKDVSCDPKRRTSYLIQEFIGLGDIFDLKNAEPGSFSCLGQSVQFQRSLHRHVAGQVGKLYFDQLFGIQWAMPVSWTATQVQRLVCGPQSNIRRSSLPASTDRLGQYNTSRVDGLKNALHVHTSGNFSNQDGSHSFRAQLLVNAQEIDFHHLLSAGRK